MRKILLVLLFVATSVSAQTQEIAPGGELILNCGPGSTAVISQLSPRRTSVRCQALSCKITIHYMNNMGEILSYVRLTLPSGEKIRVPKQNYVRESVLQQHVDKAQLDAYDKYNCRNVVIDPNPIKIEF